MQKAVMWSWFERVLLHLKHMGTHLFTNLSLLEQEKYIEKI